MSSKKKLTLSVEERLSKRAKAVAEQRGTSVSHLVETFFTALEGAPDLEAACDNEADEGLPNGREERGEQKGGPPGEHEFSSWARRWRGAFRKPGRSYPDDPSWEERMLAEEIAEKHS